MKAITVTQRRSKLADEMMINMMSEPPLEDGAVRCIEAGANVNAISTFYNYPVLYSAARKGLSKVFFHLIKNKARVDAIYRRTGDSLLKMACIGGAVEIVEYALSLPETDINCHGDAGGTALHHASTNQSGAELVLILLRAGADQTIKNSVGLTAEEYARAMGCPSILGAFGSFRAAAVVSAAATRARAGLR